jgi:hypothetical protein
MNFRFSGRKACPYRAVSWEILMTAGKAMKGKISSSLICIWLIAGLFAACTQKANQQKIVVLNPEGQPPRTPLVPMAPRLDNLDGKTIFIVDVRYPLTHQLFEEMQKVLSEKYPKTHWVLQEKAGAYMDDDPALWAEIKARGDGMIVGIGH